MRGKVLGWAAALVGLLAALALAGTALLAQPGAAHEARLRPTRPAFDGLCRKFARQSELRQGVVTGSGRRRVAVIGDSYSVGLGLRHPANAWTRWLPGQVRVFGFSGSGFSRTASPCTGASYAERAPEALASRPSLVVVEGGLNDVGQPPHRVLAGFEHLVAELEGQHVVVVGPADAPLRARGARLVDRLLRWACRREGVRYFSMIHDHFGYLGSGLHLTPASHRAFGRDVARDLRRHGSSVPIPLRRS